MEEKRKVRGGPRAAPRDVDQAREVAEASRRRVTETLGELEERLVEEKDALQERLDVVRPLREFVWARPLPAVAMAAGAGLLFGLLVAGSRRAPAEVELTDADRDVIRSWRRERRKRLIDTAEDELPSFDPPPSRIGRLFRDMTHELVGAATALLVSGLVERVQEQEQD
jgi:ElaB/YqjD/DUF883 family membrane-anchored ribosome-binding protein